MESPLLPTRLGGLALLLLLGAAGCERKIEEPIASRPLDPSSVAADQGSPAGGKARCIKPTLATAQRSTPKGPDPKCPKDDEASPPKLRTGKVTFLPVEGAGGKEIPIDIEIAENEHDRQRGLMFRTQMPEMHGMIFVFGERVEHPFWMHNTCISLDMLYIDEDGLIVGIEESTPTLTDETFSAGCASKYVLEVNGGWTRSHGVKAGQWVKIER